ncbi:hypothetical protein VC83_01151 [Pseudogymnoascus destructans]|uniref:Uncharacterized protein n=2 Tax=Pseudogymnoascus destructans TaxID=655981 RepID=L8G969_PSED2|nr:uncharacterized protein VC83_01151 [Pseudogymnoascus destructans]ELR09785.1 hypothetical protein GMDG_04269 [Pseudogymnoascus destructans 20631-21]OAF62365.1 hypothetical protein VC83_01151 [Pseudogymnoascus destructans]
MISDGYSRTDARSTRFSTFASTPSTWHDAKRGYLMLHSRATRLFCASLHVLTRSILGTLHATASPIFTNSKRSSLGVSNLKSHLLDLYISEPLRAWLASLTWLAVGYLIVERIIGQYW